MTDSKIILLATHNVGKAKEITRLFESLDWTIQTLSDLGIEDEFEENGESFEDNALGKARFFHSISGLPTMADDSGLIVDALAGELGVKTRRWGAGADASDEEWLAHFMNRMEAESDRGARFVCAAAWVTPDHETVFYGETPGVITHELEAPIHPGIPLSSVFKPESCDAVYSALPAEEKNRLSHRGQAFQQLIHFLNNA